MTANPARYGDAYLSYQRDRSLIRRMVRRLYLRNIATWVEGDAVDFGCGSGELLSLMSSASLGLEVNPAAVAYCRNELGLNVENVGEGAGLEKVLQGHTFGTFIMSHVLEHMENPSDFFQRTASACARAGLLRMVFVVPGKRGFASDRTHRVFVDRRFFEAEAENSPYRIVHSECFPINLTRAGDWFTHNELLVVLDLRQPERDPA